MDGAGLTTGSVAGSGASGAGRIMWVETNVHYKFAEVWGLWKVRDGSLMRRSEVDRSEERKWKPSLRIRLSRWRPG